MTQKHLKFIDSLPCVICGGSCGQSTHHHLLRVGREYQRPMKGQEGLMFPKIKSKGMGTKSDDRFCLPICAKHHAEAHRYGNDKEYFRQNDIAEPERLALALWKVSGQYDKAMDLMKWCLLERKKCSGLQNLRK